MKDRCYSKTIRFSDINYQLAQNEDKNAIFENWCDFLNYFDSSIHFQLSFINHKSSMKEFENVIRIRPANDDFDEIRMEYAQMLRHQLAKGNNGLVKSKYITFSIEADNIREAKPKLERIESDILNNFKILGVPAVTLMERKGCRSCTRPLILMRQWISALITTPCCGQDLPQRTMWLPPVLFSGMEKPFRWEISLEQYLSCRSLRLS